MNMSFKIRSWKVSYYQNDQRQWVYGWLTCSPHSARFHVESITNSPQSSQDTDTNRQNHSKDNTVAEDESDLLLKFSDITEVQKATSMLVFPAVTAKTRDGTVHWFSSLPDRYSVFNALDYFSRYSLLDTSNAKTPLSNPSSHVRRIQQLLQSAENSERTLAAAAADLHSQGRQLDRASVSLMEIHEDLDVGDRLLSGLNTYLGQWCLPQEYKEVEMVQISKDDVPDDQDLEVLSSELSKDQWRPQLLSFLRVTESGLLLLNSRQCPLHSFRWMDLSRIFVVSPWEVILTKHVVGRTDVSVSVVSSALLPVLRLLEWKLSHLMDYQTPPPPSESVVVSDRDSPRGKVHTPGNTSAAAWGCRNPVPGRINALATNENSSLQVQTGTQAQEEMSAEEVTALCSKLGSLKSMARAVGDELTAQNAALDDMINSVDRAESRVRDATQRTKKLM